MTLTSLRDTNSHQPEMKSFLFLKINAITAGQLYFLKQSCWFYDTDVFLHGVFKRKRLKDFCLFTFFTKKQKSRIHRFLDMLSNPYFGDKSLVYDAQLLLL